MAKRRAATLGEWSRTLVWLAVAGLGVWLTWVLSGLLLKHRAFEYCVWLGLPVAVLAYACSAYARHIPSVRARDIQVALIAVAVVLSIGALRDLRHVTDSVAHHLPGLYYEADAKPGVDPEDLPSEAFFPVSDVWWAQALLTLFTLVWLAVCVLLPVCVWAGANVVYREARSRERQEQGGAAQEAL